MQLGNKNYSKDLRITVIDYSKQKTFRIPTYRILRSSGYPQLSNGHYGRWQFFPPTCDCMQSSSIKDVYVLNLLRSLFQVTYKTLLRARSRYGSLQEVQQCLEIYQEMRKAG